MPKSTVDLPMARDLKDFADFCIVNKRTPGGKSCAALSNQVASCVTNIHRKKTRGVYDHAKAIKLYEYPVANFAKLYEAEEHVRPSKATREATAKMYRDEFHGPARSY